MEVNLGNSWSQRLQRVWTQLRVLILQVHTVRNHPNTLQALFMSPTPVVLRFLHLNVRFEINSSNIMIAKTKKWNVN